jgi:peroxiredoxin
MPLKSILAVVILYSNFLYAGVPPLEQIEEVLREEFSSHYSLISEMSIFTEIVYELKVSRRSYKEKYDLTVENGKIYSSRKDFRPEGLRISNESWNGRLAYNAWSPNSNKSGGQNSISSELILGIHNLVLNRYYHLGLMPDMIFGSYDSSDQKQLANVDNPLRVFDLVKHEEKTGAVSKIFLEETTYKGRNLIKMSLRFVVEPFKTRWPGPMVEHVLDPEFNYRAVETRRYNSTGLIESMTRNFSRDNAGNIILVSAEARRSVRSQNYENIYPKEDNDKVAVIKRYEFDTYKVNEDVDPAVYESENVFIPGLETWDTDRKVIVEDSREIVKIGDQAPTFTADIATGGQVTPADLEGKVTMLQFTASWCGVCREEMPHIEKDIWQKYKDRKDFMLLGIDIDEERDKVIRFGQDMNVTYPLVLDPASKIFHLFAETGAGVTRNVIIDRTGKIVFMTRGFKEEEFEAMKEVIDGLMK